MRHRLIPSEERRQMHREYYVRVSIVSICVLAVAVLVGAAALLPADIRARATDRVALQAVTVAKKNNSLSDLDRADKQLSEGNTLLSALANDAGQARFSAIVRSIVAIHSPIQLSSFTIGREGTSTVSVTLQGMAPTRNDLLAFKARLEGLAPGARVELPIATLAKNTNVPFSLRLTEQLK